MLAHTAEVRLTAVGEDLNPLEAVDSSQVAGKEEKNPLSS